MVDDDGNRDPVVLALNPEAKEAWKSFYNSHARELADATGDVAAALSKLEEVPGRLALVIHCSRVVAGDPSLASPDVVDRASMENAVALCEWFKNETQRVYAMLGEDDEDRAHRELTELIRRKGGAVGVRDLMRSSRRFPSAEDAEVALGELVKANLGRWEDVPVAAGGGRPSRVFRLLEPSTLTQPPETRELRGCVNVSAGSVPENTNSPVPNNWGAIK